MNDSFKGRLHRYRYELQNPYAGIEYLEEMGGATDAVEASNSAIKASRLAYEDPYALLDGNGGFSAVQHHAMRPDLHVVGDRKESLKARRYSDEEIESIVVDLQRQLWRDRYQLWAGNPPSSPIDVLDIEKALSLVGFRFALRDTLGCFMQDGRQIEVAGLFDPVAKAVYGSQQFDLGPSMNFTFAHELGHAVLHQDLGTLHRDRLKDGAYRSHEPHELEADKFATFFLMPRKLVQKQFREAFGLECFELSEDTIKGLKGITSTVDKFAKGNRGASLLRYLSRELVNAGQYNGRHFKSLRSQFRVSTGAMAIRLEELALVKS